jgi:hypothetical protein
VVWWPDRAVAERPEPSGGRVRFSLGDPGDQLVLGDWDGDGRDTPALYSPTAGRVTRFDRWAELGDAVTGTVVVTDAPVDGLARRERHGPADEVVVDPSPGGDQRPG